MKRMLHMKEGRAALTALVMAFAVIITLALPVAAIASPSDNPKVTGPQSAWWNGESHHFRSTVTDADGTELTEGIDFTRSFAYVSDRRSADKIDPSAWKNTDDDMTSSGFVWERITFIGGYSKWGVTDVRHNILTWYEFAEQNVTKVEGEADPTLSATLRVLLGDPTTEVSLDAFTLSREAGEKPGEYAITYTTDPEQIPAAYTSNTASTRTGLGTISLGGYTNICLVGDDICGYNYIKIVPGTLTIVPATTDVTVTVAWDDSSNKDGVRPSAEDYAKLLSLTADGEASDVQPAVVDNGNDTYTVTYSGVRKYAYTDNDERYEIDYRVNQASITDYTTDNASVGNNGTITNTHTVKVVPEPKKETPASAEKQATTKSSVPKTGDESVNVLAVSAFGAAALGVATIAKRRFEL